MLAPFVAQADTYYADINFRTTISHPQSQYDGNAGYEEVRLFSSIVNEKIGVGVFISGYDNLDSDDETFQELYAGLVFLPSEWLEFGVGRGTVRFEDEGELDRSGLTGGYVFTHFDEWMYTDSTFEKSDDGWFYYEHTLAVFPVSWLGVGGYAAREIGYGPRVELRFGETPLRISAAHLKGNPEKGEAEESTMLALQFEFEYDEK
jgi:hypothetical protein